MGTAVKNELLTDEKDKPRPIGEAVTLFGDSVIAPSEQSIYRWIRDGNLRATRVGGRVYVTPKAVAEFLERGLGNE